MNLIILAVLTVGGVAATSFIPPPVSFLPLSVAIISLGVCSVISTGIWGFSINWKHLNKKEEEDDYDN